MNEYSKHPSDSASVGSPFSTANPMLNLFTTCGRCELLCEGCAVVMVKTVHLGHDTVELCQNCLDEMAVMLRSFMDDRKALKSVEVTDGE
jgi:hypothetical protein